MTTQQIAFLESQASALGETPVLFTYGRLMASVPGFPALVYFLVGPAAFHIVSAEGPNNIMGFSVPKKDVVPWTPVSYPRAEVTFSQPVRKGLIARWTSPRDVLEVVAGTVRFRLEMFTDTTRFVRDWKACWGIS